MKTLKKKMKIQNKKVKDGFIGSIIPEKNISMKKQWHHYDWLSIFRSIPEGYAQQVNIGAISCLSAIKKHEKHGDIKQGEYSVRSLGRQTEKRKIFITHHKLT